MKNFFILSIFLFSAVLLARPENRTIIPFTKGGSPVIETGTWIDQASGFATASRGINYMHAVNANVAWATAYNGTSPTTYIVEFTRTSNGGTNWTASGITGYTSNWGTSMVFGVSSQKAWIPVFNASAGGGRILATTDGGSTWTHQTTAAFAAPDGFPNVVHFWNENEGFCMGDPNGGYFEIYTTTNGGTNWVRVPQGNIPAPIAADEYGVVGYYSVYGNTIWFSTNKGRIFKSTDKGLNWTVSTTPVGNNQFKIVMKDNTYGIIQVPTSGISYRTTDGGANWNFLSPVGNFFTNDYCFVPGTNNTWVSTGAATGVSGASYSFDGGLTWTDFTNTAGVQFLNVDFYSSTVGWAGAFNTSATSGGIKKYIGDLVPVELTSFNAVQIGNLIELKWTTATELNNRGFEIERKIKNGNIEENWTTIGFKNGFGTTTEIKNYSFTDDISTIEATAVYYRLKQVDYDGRFEYSPEVMVDNIMPLEFSLGQNYPNPFNPSTTINFSIVGERFVSLKVYNNLGQEIATLVNEMLKGGKHEIEFNATNFTSGVYYYTLRVGENEFVQTNKMVLMK